jgi:hypothetical protein
MRNRSASPPNHAAHAAACALAGVAFLACVAEAPDDEAASEEEGDDAALPVGPERETGGSADRHFDAKGDAASAIDSGSDSDAPIVDGRDVAPDVGADATVVDAKLPDASDASADAPPIDAGLPIDCTKLGPDGEPIELGCTGLYSNWPARIIASDFQPYAPAFALWSDGAAKSRWVKLPPGTKIDATDPNEWSFPVGTRFFKEFRLNGKRVETRMLWKTTASAWVRTTYAWSLDQTTARELRTGAQNVFGTAYEIPAQSDCETCHMGRLDGVLGFEVIGLSNTGATGLTMAKLESSGWIAPAPTSTAAVPGNATERAALGWLHANCGNACHNRSPYALAGPTGLFLRLEIGKLATPSATDTYRTAINVPSSFQPWSGAGFARVRPKDVAHSAIPFRDGSRDPGVQMPPIATHVVDSAGLTAVQNWINWL